jgi:hypothetical protein
VRVGERVVPGNEAVQYKAGRWRGWSGGLARLVVDPLPYPWWPDHGALDVRAQVYAWLCRGREVLWFDETEL